MANTYRVAYHYNSGFSVHCGDTLLVFDYWESYNNSLSEYAKLNKDILKTYKKVYVFISNSRADHLDPIIYDWQSIGNVSYISSKDVPLQPNTTLMSIGDSLALNDRISVKAFASTDLGISFFVNVDGFNIFHSGNLNLWHWSDESSPEEIDRAQEAFEIALGLLQGLKIHLAFFPLDPRQGYHYDAGALQFIKQIKPKIFVPMHFYNNTDIIKGFVREINDPQKKYSFAIDKGDTEILAMTSPGKAANIELLDDDSLLITVLNRDFETD